MNNKLYRGQILGTENWVYGEAIKQIEGKKLYCYIRTLENQQVVQVSPKSVNAYTGFDDINGVKIFRGDIVRIEGTKVGLVMWGIIQEKLVIIIRKVVDDFDKYSEGDLEVIGNMYTDSILLR